MESMCYIGLGVLRKLSILSENGRGGGVGIAIPRAAGPSVGSVQQRENRAGIDERISGHSAA
jgi:hypothetical protein